MDKGQTDFVDQMTRKMLVTWCATAISIPDGILSLPDSVFLQHALDKKWLVRVGTGFRVLASGWATATRFLKR
jgi:hypothetical protein